MPVICAGIPAVGTSGFESAVVTWTGRRPDWMEERVGVQTCMSARSQQR